MKIAILAALGLLASSCSDRGVNKKDSSGPKINNDTSEQSGGLEDAISKARKNGGSVVGIGGDGRSEKVEFGKLLSEDGSYALRLSNVSTLEVEKIEHVVLAVEPKSGFKMNKEFPTKLVLDCGDSVSLPKEEWRMADASEWDEKHGAFSVALQSKKAGQHSCKGQFNFAVCTESTCDPKRTAFEFALQSK